MPIFHYNNLLKHQREVLVNYRFLIVFSLSLFSYMLFEELYAQNFLQTTNGVQGGAVTSVARVTSNILVAGSIRGGLFRSTDNGLNWTSISSKIDNYQVFVVKSYSAGLLFVGTTRSIYKSTDQGANWSLSNNGLPSLNYVEDITFDNLGNVYITYVNWIYKSTNNGESWFAINNGIGSNPYIKLIEYTSNNILIAIDGNAGIYRSTNFGSSWSLSNTGYMVNAGPSGLASSSSGNIFISTSGNGVYSSSDNGNTWTLITGDLSYSYAYDIEVNSAGHVFLATFTYLFKTTNGGVNWIDISPSSVNLGIYSVDIDNNDDLLVGTYYNGIAKSTDGGSNWTLYENGISSTIIKSLVNDSAGNLFAAVEGKALYKSTDNANNWNKINISNDLYNQNILCAAFIPSGGLIVNASIEGIYTSNDYTNWTPFQTGLPTTLIFELAASSNYFFAGSLNGKLYRSPRTSAAWIDITDTLNINYVYDIKLKNPNEVFVATNSGIFKSTNNGDSWINVNNGIPSTFYFSLAVHPNGDIFAGGIDNVYRSTDGGNSWTASSTNVSALSLIVHPNGSIFAGSFSSVYRSNDLGNTWNLIGTGMENISVKSLAFGNSDILFAGTDGYGIYRTSLPITSIESEQIVLINDFELKQNYPNPFNPATNINYQLARGSYVSLKVYDILGNEVAVLVDEFKPAGSYDVSFDAINLPSGVYIYTLNTENSSFSKKMMLLR